MFIIFKTEYFQLWFSAFLRQESHGEVNKIQHFSSSNRRSYLPHHLSDKDFKDTVVNREMSLIKWRVTQNYACCLFNIMMFLESLFAGGVFGNMIVVKQ